MKIINNVFLLWLVVFLLFSLTGSGQDAVKSNSPGIFEATADWGFDSDIKLKRGSHKVSGAVDVSEDEDDLHYQLSGNGDDIWDEKDEGFFTFKEMSGSWTVSAKVNWMESGGGNEWAKAGLMIREEAFGVQSKNYGIFLLLGRQKTPGDSIQAQWRGKEGDLSYSANLTKIQPESHPESDEGIYLRLTRDSLQNSVYSDWSYDNVNWNFLHRMPLEMKEKVSYGLAITNHLDNMQRAQAAISNVSMMPALPSGSRFLSSSRFANAEDIYVLLDIQNPHQKNMNVGIQETVPSGWDIRGISHGGRDRGGLITWSLSLAPGSTSLQYTIHSALKVNQTGTFKGTVDANPIRGAKEVILSNLEAEDFAKIEFYQTLFFTTVPLIMMILHFCLFLFNPRAKENFYFAVLLGCLAGAEFVWNKNDFVTDENMTRFLNVMFLCLVIGLMVSLEKMFTFLIYKEKPDSQRKKGPMKVVIDLIIIMVFLSFASEFFGGFGIFRFVTLLKSKISMNMVIVVLFSVLSLMWLRILIVGIIKRLEGIWIIGAGTVILLFIIFWLGLSFFSIVPPLPDPKLVDVSFLLFIITLSVYLAFKFAKSNTRLELLTVELDSRVNERTKELEISNRKLHETNEELRELDKMKTAFVSQASHDLRTPLTAIKGSLDNLVIGIAGEMNAKQKKIMERATKSVDRLTNLINDILDLNRIESGRIVLEKKPVSLRALVENCTQENLSAANQRSIILRCHTEPKPYTMTVDGGKIERIVGELIGNALKYTPEKGTVDVVLNDDGKWLVLQVKDSGIGIPENELPMIWDRFYRSSISKTFAKGSGLGLSIAKELIEMHGGSIQVASKQNQGTEFTVRFPMEEEKSYV